MASGFEVTLQKKNTSSIFSIAFDPGYGPVSVVDKTMFFVLCEIYFFVWDYYTISSL